MHVHLRQWGGRRVVESAVYACLVATAVRQYYLPARHVTHEEKTRSCVDLPGSESSCAQPIGKPIRSGM